MIKFQKLASGEIRIPDQTLLFEFSFFDPRISIDCDLTVKALIEVVLTQRLRFPKLQGFNGSSIALAMYLETVDNPGYFVIRKPRVGF